MGVYKLRDDGIVPLICPTCQNVFAGSLKASMPATTCYFAWGCFRYFSWEREPRRACGEEAWLAEPQLAAAPAFARGAFAPVRLRFRCAQATPDTTLCWRRAGVWSRIMDALAAANDAAVQMIDTSIVRVDQHGVCITRNRVQSMGRSRVG